MNGHAGLHVSGDLALPLDVAGETIAILGKRGSGKTNTATVVVEELVSAGVQTVILDPVGAWWGLRSNAAGDGPGLEIPRLGGQHGDVPLEQTAGSLVADVVIQSRQSLLIDLSDFPTKAAVGRFVTDFAERLYRQKKADSVLHLVLEEADSFAPQKVKGSERMQGAIEQIVRRGRARGMGVTLITQRSAVLSKDVLTQADVLIVMRTTGPHDLRAIREWIDSRGDEHGAGVLDSLPSLDTGEGWVWNPEREIIARTQFRARETFDSSRTPKAGELRVEPEQAAPIDIASLGEQIRATAEKAKAEDPAELRKRIRALEADLKKRPTEEVVREVQVEVPFPVFNGEIEKLEEMATALLAASTSFVGAADDVVEAVQKVKGDTSVATAPARPVARPTSRVERAPRPARAQPRSADPHESADGFAPTVPQQRILNAIAWLDSVAIEPERKRVAIVAGYMPSSGGFRNLVSSLASAGAISYPATGIVALTDLGAALADEPEPVTSTAELQARITAKLKQPQLRVLEPLLGAYPEALSREDLAEAAGYEQSGGFRNLVSSLSSLDLVDYPSSGYVRASSVLFLD